MLKKYHRKSCYKIIGLKLGIAFQDKILFGGAQFKIWCLPTLRLLR